jgi:putative flavoprotein involved in K+ transport
MQTDVLVIGAGQCGLAVSRQLSLRGIEHAVVDGRAAPGDVWRDRWDTLRLFTPAHLSSLPGMPFPAPRRYLPKGKEFGAYLDAYAARFNAPLHSHTQIRRLTRDAGGTGFRAETEDGTWLARRVVVATGFATHPRIPAFARELDPSIAQLHSSAYHRPADLPEGPVLVVGCGTSGVQLGVELARSGRHVIVAGKPTPRVPRIVTDHAFGLLLAIAHHVLTRATPIGRAAVRDGLHGGAPLFGISAEDLDAAGAERGPRLAGTRDGQPVLEDGRVLNASSVLWATGFRHDYPWIEGLATDDEGLPRHTRGVSQDWPGLSFMGLPVQFGFTSMTIYGVGRDAAYVAAALARPTEDSTAR